MKTQMGTIAGMLNESEDESTPLQKKLDNLGKLLGIVCLAICGIIFLLGLLRGMELFDIFMTSVSLAVAAIPEGLTVVVTVVLAMGMQRMVKCNAIIKRLSAVETLGSTTVICSDKTGTLTQNKMTVQRLYDASPEPDTAPWATSRMLPATGKRTLSASSWSASCCATTPPMTRKKKRSSATPPRARWLFLRTKRA